MRYWEPVWYTYANFSVLESSAPSVTGPHLRVPYPLCRFDTAGARIFFLSLSLDPFFPIFQPPPLLFFRFITLLYHNGALSLYFTIIACTLPEAILVCISV